MEKGNSRPGSLSTRALRGGGAYIVEMNGFVFIVRRRRVDAFQINDSRRQIGSNLIDDGNFFRDDIVRGGFTLRSFGGDAVV